MMHRDRPAYLEYAASMLAERHFRLMTATQRGVLYSMKLECWANKTLPAEPGALAVILGLDAREVADALPVVMPFFDYVGEDIVCPELDAYRAHLEERHLRQSQGGKEGADITNKNRKKSRKPKSGAAQEIPLDAANLSATPSAAPAATSAASGQLLNTNQIKPNQSNSPSVKGLVPTSPWADEYESAQRAECTEAAYRNASRGA